ncbi:MULTISPECIES: hypothetical protein [Calothrix]|uniref:Uncharacterized protein n=2 Tax=Calothrix TaxID=1186 RepID=A0ABR8ADE9_9CYAN|nr:MULTISPECIES: hypothetical protein [Calothrix]MBD2197938.1 hypothetical protein [Calothrix parietina FACHB-288]MBD2226777.1 hypothetical protein [Calothrix anomala FACHB-343]
MINKTDLILSLGYLIGQILNGDMDNPETLAKSLEGIADRVWDEYEAALLPPSLRIDP